jgi:hypothetical protein
MKSLGGPNRRVEPRGASATHGIVEAWANDLDANVACVRCAVCRAAG